MPTWASGFYLARFAPGGGVFSTNLEQDTHTHTFLSASLLGSQVGLGSCAPGARLPIQCRGFGVLVGGGMVCFVCVAPSLVGSSYRVGP